MRKLFMLFGLLPIMSLSHAQNPLLDALDFGDYTPAYRLIQAYDQSRPPMAEQASGDGRLVPVYFWYPSNKKVKSAMTFKSYLNDLAYALGETVPESEVSQKAKETFSNYHFDSPDSILTAYMSLNIHTLAGRNLTMAKGDFPVVVFSHGNVDRWWIWGEFLASHGIAVVGTPNSGTFYKRHEMGISGLETQIRDAQFAVSVAAGHESINADAVITVGSSYGSLTAAGYATRDHRVKGVISLDGIIADVNEGELLTQTPFFDYQRFKTPILHVNSGFGWSSNYTLMDRMTYADQYRIEMKKLRHGDYHFEGMADLFGANFRGGKLIDNSVGFKSLTRYALAFIKGVTGDSKQLELLSTALPETTGYTFVNAKSKAYSATELLKTIRTEGFDKAADIYKQAKSKNPQPFSAATFYEVGLTLHRYSMVEEEIEWFRFYQESYPKSADAQYRLARLMALTGKAELGKEMLKKAVEMIPSDPDISQDRKDYLLSRVLYFLSR